MSDPLFWFYVWAGWTAFTWVLTFVWAVISHDTSDFVSEWAKAWWLPLSLPLFLAFVIILETMAMHRMASRRSRPRE